VLRYRVATAYGRRVENTLPIGLVRDFPSEKAAWREVDTLGLLVRINSDAPAPGRIHFASLAEHYLRADFGQDAVRPKTEGTTANTQQIVRQHLIPRWGNAIAEDIKPLDLQRWLKSLHSDKELAWTTVSKIRGVMLRIYKVGILHELVSKRAAQQTTGLLSSLRSKHGRFSARCPVRSTAFWCSPVPQPLCGRQNCLRFGGQTSGLRMSGYGYPNAGRGERPGQPKLQVRTVLCRCIPVWGVT
jgi:hypothetical protein